MKNQNYIHILGWMINSLNLKANELLIYAIIYGFSQDGNSKFTGSIKYIEKSLLVSRNTVIKALKNLIEKGLIIKDVEVINGVIFNKYSHNDGVVQKLHIGSAEIAPPPSAEIAPNNTNIYNTNNNTNIDFKKLLDFINITQNRASKNKFKVINQVVRNKYKARIKDGYTKEDILNAIKNVSFNEYHKKNNFQYATPEFFSRADVLDKYGFSTTKTTIKKRPIEIINDGGFVNF